MVNKSKNYTEEIFEGDKFIHECLESQLRLS